MEYVIPELTGYVNKSRPYTVVGLTGENLDIVTGVLFGTKEATVVTQTREEIEVEVPYFKDEAVDIVLNYQYGTEIRQVSTSGHAFLTGAGLSVGQRLSENDFRRLFD